MCAIKMDDAPPDKRMKTTHDPPKHIRGGLNVYYKDVQLFGQPITGFQMILLGGDLDRIHRAIKMGGDPNMPSGQWPTQYMKI